MSYEQELAEVVANAIKLATAPLAKRLAAVEAALEWQHEALGKATVRSVINRVHIDLALKVQRLEYELGVLTSTVVAADLRRAVAEHKDGDAA